MSQNKAALEKARALLGKSPDYKVLTRLTELIPATRMDNEPVYTGMYLDVETEGLDTERDAVIEFGGLLFDFTSDGRIVAFGKRLHYYQMPKKPISEEITKLTGITNEMVMDKKIDVGELEEVLDSVVLVVAHNASFDRPMVERISKKFCALPWGCSMAQVEWKDFSISGRKLEYVLSALGYFYDAHNAISDCEAGLFALQAAVNKRTALEYLLKATREPTVHVWAIDAAFAAKDKLKERGYYWNGGEDGRAKSWHKEIKLEEQDAERAWLERVVYQKMLIPALFNKVTARERFTKRG